MVYEQAQQIIDLIEAKVLIEQRRREYNQVRPPSALDYRLLALKAIMPATPTL